jgi:hypothetical protein
VRRSRSGRAPAAGCPSRARGDEVVGEVESPVGTRRRRQLGRSTGGAQTQLMVYELVAVPPAV